MPRLDFPRVRWLVFFLTAFVLVAADQITKNWIRGYDLGEVIFRRGFFRIQHIENAGAGFGLFQGYSSALLVVDFVALGLILLYLIFLFGRFGFPATRTSWVALGLIFSGTTGNLIDRLNPAVGGITDFIYIGPWPAFNVADSSITIGVVLLAYSLLFTKQKT
ncbi:MAG: signal peptidase II [Chloroflexi bacterium RBG_16_57_8]|nr:MAG: signal peptidase II [Chloroflexi bacterium RBG_16_57_8]